MKEVASHAGERLRLGRFTLNELLDRTRQALLSRVEGIPYVGKWVLPSTDKYFVADARGLTALARHLGFLPSNSTMRDYRDSALPESSQKQKFRSSADCALEGYFNVLGLEQLDFGRPINWHLEPASGRRSPLVPWKRLDSLDASVTGDKKVVWELNRHQHLLTFSRTFLDTGKEHYAEAVREHIASWIRENPPTLGINWVSSLEIAFRCISWLWAIALIRTWSKFPSLPLPEIERSLYLQGCHIERYLSTYSSPNTHLTGEALGLYYLGTCLPELNRAERWRSIGRSILLQQLEKHVRPDGVYFEQSSWYHRYTTDFYTHFILLSEGAGEALPTHVRNRLAALLDHLMWVTRPDGTSPYLGDDDGGKLVKLEERAPNDWRAALSNGALMFGRGDYKHVAGEFAEETYWLFGPDAMEQFERILAKPPPLTSRAFVDGGFYVMRSGWSRDSNYLLVDCGPHGVMNCGHAHADALAIEVAALGATVLVDPGTFTYTGSAEMRDLFRSTAMHNTLTIDGLSSSDSAGPFKWKQVANSTLHCWHDHPGFTFFEGSHDGYKRLPDPATHTRSVMFVNREYWIMLDRVDATGEHEYAVHFHMAQGIDAALDHENCRLEARATTATLDIVYFEKQGAWHLTDGLVSPCYAAKVKAPIGVYSVQKKGPLGLLSVLIPRAPGQLPPDIRGIKTEQGEGLALSTPQSHDFVLWSGVAVPQEGLHSSDFEWVWVRRPSVAHPIKRAVLLHGSRFSAQNLEVNTQRPVEFIAVSVQDRALSIDILPSAEIRIHPPTGVDRIAVNGRIYPLGSEKKLTVPQQDVRALAPPRDENDRCKHVRN